MGDVTGASVADAVARVASLYADHHDDPIPMLHSLRGTPELAVTRTEVRAVALHYFRMADGGAEQVNADLAALLRDMGLHVVMVVYEGQPVDLVPEGIAVERIPELPYGVSDATAHLAALADVLDRHDVDAFVDSQWLGHMVPWDIIMAKELGRAVVVHTHGIFTLLATEPDPVFRHEPAAFSLADALVCLSATDAAFYRQLCGNVFQTFNLPRITTADTPPAPLDGHRLLWVGRLSHDDKRPDRALDILSRVVRTVPDATLTFLGDGDPAYVDELRARAADLGVADGVTFAGYQPEVRPHLATAALQLVTSAYEGYGLAIAEAKVAGVPCVCYELAGNVFCADPRGLVAVPQDDADAAAREVAAILADDALRHRLGDEARAQARELEDYDRSAFWRDVLGTALRGEKGLGPASAAGDAWAMLWRALADRERQVAASEAALRRELAQASRPEPDQRRGRGLLARLRHWFQRA